MGELLFGGECDGRVWPPRAVVEPLPRDDRLLTPLFSVNVLQEYYAGLGRKGDTRPASMVGKRLGA